jgi:hypothetical protein
MEEFVMPTRGGNITLYDPPPRISPVRRPHVTLPLVAVAFVALLGASTIWGASVVVHVGFAELHLHDTAVASTYTRPGGER